MLLTSYHSYYLFPSLSVHVFVLETVSCLAIVLVKSLIELDWNAFNRGYKEAERHIPVSFATDLDR